MELDAFIDLLAQRPLYHFTDVRNLPSIRQHGLLSLHTMESRGITVAHPGGNSWSHDADRRRGFHRYVHLCLLDQHPMEWQARQSGHIGDTKFLHVDSSVVRVAGTMGCALVSNRAGSRVLPLAQALDEMDLEVLFRLRVDLKDEAQRNRYNEAKKAEILVPDMIPTALIRNLQ